MLIHQNHTSEGSVNPAVKVKSRTFTSEGIFTPAVYSGLRFGSDGVLSKVQANDGLSAISGEWLISGAASDFWCQRTVISGTLEVDAGSGFINMAVNLNYKNIKSSVGTKTTVVFFEISNDASGVPIVETATITFVSILNSGE